ncbi:MAG: hypothetical protein IKR48_10790 [Kiritimatiellae bacterium]|nr:hypothetical protein [Kiritimatiellia bacterium]
MNGKPTGQRKQGEAPVKKRFFTQTELQAIGLVIALFLFGLLVYCFRTW